jgi:hypothetical protein
MSCKTSIPHYAYRNTTQNLTQQHHLTLTNNTTTQTKNDNTIFIPSLPIFSPSKMNRMNTPNQNNSSNSRKGNNNKSPSDSEKTTVLG